MNPVLLVIAGPNGSGKTTITEHLRAEKWSEGVEYLNPVTSDLIRFGGLELADKWGWEEIHRSDSAAAARPRSRRSHDGVVAHRGDRQEAERRRRLTNR